MSISPPYNLSSAIAFRRLGWANSDPTFRRFVLNLNNFLFAYKPKLYPAKVSLI
ncbi:MAG: hypothetical protein F6J90_36400 [Moorea sp. SIOASIH]|nr:hypothetical protein [Moorena sp. SIOASIH]